MAGEQESSFLGEIVQQVKEKAKELFGGESAAEKAAKEAEVARIEAEKQKAIQGIKDTQRKRGEKISNLNKGIKKVDKNISGLEKQLNALDVEQQKGQVSALSQREALVKKLEGLKQQREELVGGRQELIDFNNNKKNAKQTIKAAATEATPESNKGAHKEEVTKPTTETIKEPIQNTPKEGVKMENTGSNTPNSENKGTASTEQKTANAEPAKTEAAGEVKKIEELYAKSSKGELLAEHKITNKDGVDLGAKHNELNSEIKTTKEAIETAAEGDKKALSSKLETLEKDHKAVSEELIKGKEAIYKEKVGFVDGIKARFAGTFGEVNKSTSSKVVRGTGLAVGLGAIVDGTRRIIAPERDENGERKGSAWAAVGEIGAGAGAIALALKGGHHRAMGIA